MDKLYIGIDIGQNGGIVVLDNTGGVVETFKTPSTRMEFHQALSKYANVPCFCILENVHSQPKNGGKANFQFGMTNERTLYSLEVNRIPYQAVTPQTWMKTYMLKKDKGESNTNWKNRLKQRAQQLFPNEKVVLWSADALLMAEFARRHYK